MGFFLAPSPCYTRSANEQMVSKMELFKKQILNEKSVKKQFLLLNFVLILKTIFSFFSDPDPRFYYGTELGPGQNNMEPEHCCPYLSWGKCHPCNKQVASALSGPKLRSQIEEKEGGG